MKYAKAIVGGVIAALSSVEAALANGSSFTARDYVAAAVAGLVAASGVAFVSNKQ